MFCRGCYEFISGEHLHRDGSFSCFICTPANINPNCPLKASSSWREAILKTYSKNYLAGGEKNLARFLKGKNGELVVLSLCDGISVGIVALQALGLEIKKYWAFEIDETARKVSRGNHGNKVTHVEPHDITRITEETIRKLGPIDLLLMSPPCQDFSKANCKAKGLYGMNQFLQKRRYVISRLVYTCDTPCDFSQKSLKNHVFWIFPNFVFTFIFSDGKFYEC